MKHSKSEKTPQPMKNLAELVLQENKKYNLTGIKTLEGIISKHIEDSKVAANYIKNDFPKAKRVIDIGTGAGFPGLIIAIENPNKEIVLLDSTSKKINFIELAKKQFNLSNVIPLHSRVESYAEDNRNQFDIVIARAVARLDILLEYAAPLLRTTGTLLAMKSEKLTEELMFSQKAEEITGITKQTPFEYQIEGHKRYIVVYKKVADSKILLPRRPGIATKRPLGG